MNDDIRLVLAELAGLPLWGIERAADTLRLHFGERRARNGANGAHGENGSAGDVGALSMHVACAWRLTDERHILVGSGDLFTPADPDEDPATFDWEEPGASWLDVRLGELAERRGGAPLVVEGASVDAFGGVRLTLEGGVVLELFPNSTPTGHVATEFWRITRGEGGEPDWVVGTFGVEREPPT